MTDAETPQPAPLPPPVRLDPMVVEWPGPRRLPQQDLPGVDIDTAETDPTGYAEIKARTYVHLGTWVYPHLPFPYTFPEARVPSQPPVGSDVGEPDADSDLDVDVETRATILIPHGHIPAHKPDRPRIWGGGVVPPPPRRLAIGLVELGLGHKVPGKRRVYTDDSDVFSCAVHAGWANWSGARRARREGRDVRIEVRVLRCVAAGVVNGVGVGAAPAPTPALASGAKPGIGGTEEIVGRFIGGWGEKCFNPYKGKTHPTAKRRTQRGSDDEDEDEDDSEDNSDYEEEEDDGRGLVSAGWGAGHDGSAIEILKLEFVERGTVRSLGRRNRSQRLLEYAERRSSVLRLAGRKRRRGWDSWPAPPPSAPNAVLLGVIYEEEEEEEERVLDAAATREDMQMGLRTLVFGPGSGGVHVGYKYDPMVLKDILFPPASAATPPPRKRQRIEEPIANMMDVDTETAEHITQRRAIILETPKESYLLSPSDGMGMRYDVSLLLDGYLDVHEIEAEHEGTQVDVAPIEKPGKDAPKEAEGEKTPTAATRALPLTTTGNGDTSVTDNEVTPTAESVPLPSVAPSDTDPTPAEVSPDGSGATALPPSASLVTPIAPAVSTDTIIPSPPRTISVGSDATSNSMDISPLSSPPPASPHPAVTPESPTPSQSTAAAPAEAAAPPPDHPVPAPSPPPPDVIAPPAELNNPLSPPAPAEPTAQPPTSPAVMVLEDSTRQPLLQELQRHLPEEAFGFAKDGVKVFDGIAEDGTRVEWTIQVQRWKWAPPPRVGRDM
ncbi:hypothetical protein BD779DRAFT_96066 [Infundibulicybe gibba]|nr:hypothetical protein BD779DRAFT_96066 [Infundibulicybe gibba]